MPELPHGWRMRNSNGEVAGPPPEEDGFHSGDDGSEGSEGSGAEALDIRPDSEGWDDVDAEDDTEALSIKCLLCDSSFPIATVMIAHCKEIHDFDFAKTQQQHKLDFYSTIKLVNYIRSEVIAGKVMPDASDPRLWADDKFLQPALEEDALLFTLDDIVDAQVSEEDDAK